MKLRMVYIKRAGGEIASEACYAAYRGFMAMGYPVNFFEHGDLQHNRLRLDHATLLVGGTQSVHTALHQIGVAPPQPLNIPQSLRQFCARDIWQTDLESVRVQSESWPVFIKPLVDTKSFKGTVIKAAGDLVALRHLPGETLIQASTPVRFVSEWRYFIHAAQVVGLAHYSGDWAVFPDSQTVLDAISAYAASPVAYALDFGVNDAGETILVEANDAFALGAHGLDCVAYARLLEARWLEMTAGNS